MLASRLAGCALLMLVHPISFGDVKKPEEADLIGRIDLAVPDVPAATILGMSPDTVIRPATGKDFVASLLNGVGQDGKLQAGLAFDVRPALYLAQEYFSLANYRDENAPTIAAGTRFEHYKMKPGAYWTKLRLSIATGRTESSAGKDADRYAIGASFNIFDDGDSRLSPAYRVCVNAVIDSLLDDLERFETAGKELNEAERQQYVNENRPKVKRCAKEFEDSHWNADSWDAGAAYFNVNTDAVKSKGYAIWTTYARHLGTEGQLILHGRFTDNEVVADPKDKSKFVIQDSRSFGARLRWRAPGGAFMLEATRRHTSIEHGTNDNYTLASAGYEFRISDGLWLQTAIGKAYGTDAFKNDPIYSGQFRWGRTGKSLLEN